MDALTLKVQEPKKVTPVTLEGQTLGKYRILEPLGRGGMAQVHRAYHPQLDRYVAVKVLRTDLVEEEEFLARFRREAQSVAGLRHPHIVQVFDFDVQDDLYFMVMELLDGDTLKTRLNSYRTRGVRMPIAEMVRILTEVLDGLGYAHSEGIIHRDLKPANILLSKRGQAVLTDFGIAQIVGGTRYTMSGALMGTLHYMAPEQGLQGRTDVRSDLYSMGIIFYEMLMGNPPFDADTPLAILMKHVNDPLPLPRQIDPAIPEVLERILLKALAKDPGDRYQSAAEMTRALQEALAKIPVDDTLRSMPVTAVEADDTPAPVLSGEARRMLADASLMEDDTDAELGKHLQPAAGESSNDESMSAAAQAFATAAVGLASQVASKVRSGLEEGLKSPQVAQAAATVRSGLEESLKSVQAAPGAPGVQTAESDPAEPARPTRAMSLALLVGVGSLVMVNAFLLLGAAFGGRWMLLAHAWPVELLLVALLLSSLMAALRQPGILIPAGLLLFNGLLLAFYSTTGRWEFWLPWLLEPLVLFILITVTVRWLRSGESGRQLARRAGLVLAAVSAMAVVPLLVVGALVTAVFG